jgi:glycosyltransferase involved in cell wall biosynthesis
VNLLYLLTYYHPHLSGLTIAARNRVEGLAARGHRVTVVCSQHKQGLLLRESLPGVEIVRVPVRFRSGKGVWMPGLRARLREHAAVADALVQCLPVSPMEAWASAGVSRALRKPLVLDYACDLQLPGGWGARLTEAAVMRGHLAAGRQARAIVVSTQSYADASPFLTRFPEKLRIVPLTMRIGTPEPSRVAELRAQHAAQGEKLIGFAGRMAAEKGVEVLLDATVRLREQGLPVRVLIAGEVDGVIGEQRYRDKILGRIRELRDGCRVLGVIQPDLSAFYAACDVLALPSLNRTESFGMVQAEAMRCGTPVVASRLPGVRESVERTGMGLLVEPGDAGELAEALARVLRHPEEYRKDPAAIEQEFSAARSLDVFEAMLREVVQ